MEHGRGPHHPDITYSPGTNGSNLTPSSSESVANLTSGSAAAERLFAVDVLPSLDGRHGARDPARQQAAIERADTQDQQRSYTGRRHVEAFDPERRECIRDRVD